MKQDEKQRKIKIAVSVILAAVMIVCIAAIAVYYIKEKRAGDIYEEMQQQNEQITNTAAVETEKETIEETETAVLDYEGMPEVDFESLWETNTDICAWITVPGTQVNYPVVQNAAATDPHDSYYLMRTVEKASGLPGAIYIEPCNEADFTDENTVIYGHNMKNGSMFGSLHDFKDDTFFQEHEYAYVVTPQKNLVYRIFAMVVYDDRHIMGSYDFSNTVSYQAFLDSLASNRNMGDLFREDTEVTTENKIITMSTCIKGQDDKRLLVEAVLIDEYEK